MFKTFSVSRSGRHEVVVANVLPLADVTYKGRQVFQKVKVQVCSPMLEDNVVEREYWIPLRASRSSFVKDIVDPFTSEVLSRIDW